MKKEILILSIIFLSGCTLNQSIDEYMDSTNNNEAVVSINNYFNENITSYSEQLIGYYMDCLNGSCPQENPDYDIKIKECWFCENEYNGVKGGNFMVAMGPTGGSDSFAGCTKQNYMHETFGEFKILEKTDNKIRVQINKTGTYTQLGDCDNFKYNYILEYEWVFEK
jgi:hypothetical protein